MTVATAPAPPVTLIQSGDLGLGDVVVPGVGVIPAAEIALLSRAVGTRVTRALVDPAAGTVLETMTHSYRPTAAIRRLVVTRDQHCRFPGCTMPAVRCDLDHVIAWPGGITAAINLHCLCRHHHRAKHESGWVVTMTVDGVCTWTSPSGRLYVTRPGD
ncbi:HNH endonuclease signature motif containing protein [Flexivirga caeni]|uniref:HNH endonuclease n=1 Tax=Flexivirga caeni TaxID=2294115 RepID=A0A3M9MII3_9MICO|nr:HNH endonuclease signature motif containing protein [Flexivirga caeni]RNI25341.1 HNH endonuclease [Flexivirga caeni]